MRGLLGAACALAVMGAAFAAPASAQTQSASTNAGAVANAVVYTGNGGGGGGTTTYRGGIENVPSMLGSLAVAPCTTAAQIGGAFMGGGFTASLGSESEGCARRANAAAFHALGRDDIALALLAQDKTVAAAIKTVEDAKAAAQAQQAAQMAAQPAAQPRPMLVSATVPRPDWCDRASPTTEAGRNFVQQQCGLSDAGGRAGTGS